MVTALKFSVTSGPESCRRLRELRMVIRRPSTKIERSRSSHENKIVPIAAGRQTSTDLRTWKADGSSRP